MKTNFTLKKTISQGNLLLLALFVLLAVPSSHAQTKHVVEVSNTIFTPDELQIEVGDTVEWVNVEGFHNVNGTQQAYPSNPESFGNNTGNGWTYSYVFNTAGEYDYHCDPHVGLGMTGKVVVAQRVNHILTLDFNGMNPHIGQDLWVAVIDKNSGEVIARETENISAADFSLEFTGIEIDHSYNIDFYVDFNENGIYDAPNVDHAWRLDLDNLEGDTTLTFQHNTNFTDIMWNSMLTIQFSGMTPHVGQDLWLSLVDKDTELELDRLHAVVEENFVLHTYRLNPGQSYNIDFFVDFNENGMYDAPPADHAWRLDLDNTTGDTTVVFEHNTDFTDIMWENRLTVQFNDMTPHVGQELWLSVYDPTTGKEIDRVHTIAEEEFIVNVYGIKDNTMYNVDFYVDYNNSGAYEAPPVDHSWRLELNHNTGDTTLFFGHNIAFQDIMWKNRLSVHFTGMTPHIGQDLWLAVVDQSSGMEIERIKATVEEDFVLNAYGIETGESYYVDFFVDFNENGSYDAPPADHAWRMELNNVVSDETLMFEHNTDFTDIMWRNKLEIHFTGMTPHVGQQLNLAVINKDTGEEATRARATITEEFMLHIWGIKMGASYYIDFYADFNENGSYDAPPEDHAWRLELDNVSGDTTLLFNHNTNFTDIMWKHELTVQFTSMTPHIGQLLKLYVVDMEDGLIKDSVVVSQVDGAEFEVESYSLVKGHSYYINFFADFNLNGSYDVPPVDHAWQLTLNNAEGDTTLTFEHNTNFTDIFDLTSIEDDGLAELRMYPNPAKEKIWIESRELNNDDLKLSIFDITGKLFSVESKTVGTQIELDIRKLKQGIYLIEIESSKQNKMLKFIKE